MSDSSLAARGARVRALWQQPEFRRGMADMGPILPGIAAWGLVLGVAMVKSGIGAGPSIAMSLIAFSGTGQLAALPLIAAGAPLLLIWATVLCVNLRFVVFSAQWRPYFVHLPLSRRLTLAYFCADLNYISFARRFPEPRPAPEQWPYFWGGSAANWGTWQISSIAGILLADQVPLHWGLGFAGTMALLAMTYQLITDRAQWLAALVAAGAAVASFALPLKLNIMVAIAAAVTVGVMLDHLERRRQPGVSS